jgi:hypothetical protein
MCYAFNLIVRKNKQKIYLGKASIKCYQNNTKVLLDRMHTRWRILRRDIDYVFARFGFNQDVIHLRSGGPAMGPLASGHTGLCVSRSNAQANAHAVLSSRQSVI